MTQLSAWSMVNISNVLVVLLSKITEKHKMLSLPIFKFHNLCVECSKRSSLIKV